MVMQARIITEADRQVFDDYIASVPKGHILQSYEWGENQSPGQKTPGYFP